MKRIISIVILIINMFVLSSCVMQQKKLDYDAPKIECFKIRDELPTIRINGESYNEISNYINYENIECPYSELFGIKQALAERENREFVVKKHTYDFFEGKKEVDVEKLYDTVKKNNDEYLNGISKHFNKKLSNSKLKKSCKIVADTINWGINNIEGIDLDELGCILGNLKILNRGTMNLGTFNDKNDLLNVSPSMINAKKERNGNADMYELTICHETMHILQCRCTDVPQSEDDSFIGTSYRFQNLEVNPLKSSWLYEASAELNATQKYYSLPTTYTYMIDNLETISLVSLLDNCVEAQQLEKLCFTKEHEKLYKQIGFDDEEKSIAFLYVVELLRNKPEDFKNAYEKMYNTKIDDYGEFLKRTYNPYFVEVTSKLLYKNLAKQLLENDMPLNDAFYIISLYELDLLKDIPFDSIEVREKYFSVYEDYISLRNKFLECIQEYILEDVKVLFENYEINYGDDNVYANATFKWLDENKSEYLLLRNRFLFNKKYISQKNRI